MKPIDISKLQKLHTEMSVSEEFRGDLICMALMAGLAINKEDAEFYDQQMGEKFNWIPHVDVFGVEGLTYGKKRTASQSS